MVRIDVGTNPNRRGGDGMANARKWRRKKMAKHKHRKRLKKTRWKRRQIK
jgi:hypothetical protein